ncbi:cobalamin biosynthesis protein [Pseudonocardia oroxyli]|uniref:cobalamin biosynthesis protein n=1 Tax=Pseudonocardia oroxyli TaxID=366584 RepID=UPI000B8488FA|nr:cobalamin biosynthesis protein [Pseudonocardia oroxyli]
MPVIAAPGMVVVVGIGARRGVSAEAVRAALARLERDLPDDPARPAARIYASVDTKADEAGILAAIAPAPLHTRPAAALATVAALDSAVNPLVEAVTGTPSVAAAAALFVAREIDPAARLAVAKTVVGPVTVAAALADTPEGYVAAGTCGAVYHSGPLPEGTHSR